MGLRHPHLLSAAKVEAPPASAVMLELSPRSHLHSKFTMCKAPSHLLSPWVAPTPELEDTWENSPIPTFDGGKGRRPREEVRPRGLALWLAGLVLSKPSGCPHTYATTRAEKVYSLASVRSASLLCPYLPTSPSHKMPSQVW